MCGITGFAVPPGREVPERAVLERMVASLEHRGPDDDGFHLEAGVGLGHRRLSIIDVAGGRNPLSDDAGRAVLIFNGELYNHRGLRAQLEAQGARFSSDSDGEVLLHGYLAWGWPGVLQRVRGMYAAALLDRADGTLHLARDPLGIKPLFVHSSAERLLFGSEIKSLLAAMDSRPPLCRRGLLQCVTLGYTLSPTTIFEGVESLPPGTWLSFAQGKVTRGRHHQLRFEPGREAADPDVLWSKLSGTVGSHLMSEVPLGAFLSGGVDSSAVVTAMSEVSEGPVQAVCVGIGEGLDERPFARDVAGGLGVALHEETAEPNLLDLLPRLAWHVEQPFGDTSLAPTWLVCEAARRHVTVALSGDGGDENFAGYRRTRYDVLEDVWRARLPASLRTLVLAPLGRHWPRGPWLPRALRAGTLLSHLGHDWLDAYISSLSRVPEAVARLLVREEHLDNEPLRASFEPAASRTAGLDRLSRVMAMDFATWLPDDILVKVDRASMAHSLEVRVPLLDTDFVDWAAGLPLDAKLDQSSGQGKQLFRRALRRRVPDGVLDRPKQGFHLPVSRWLHGGLRERVEAVLADEQGPAADYLQIHRMRRLWREHLAHRADRSAELWFLLMMDAFLRHGPGGTETSVVPTPVGVGTRAGFSRS